MSEILQPDLEHQAEAWLASANRAEIRGEFALAIYFRNLAWKCQTGQEWLDDITLKEENRNGTDAPNNPVPDVPEPEVPADGAADSNSN
jgi:hypothetical protein